MCSGSHKVAGTEPNASSANMSGVLTDTQSRGVEPEVSAAVPERNT
jgi:hypothetical protein